MLLHEMNEDECRAALKEMDFGRLACVRGDRPYIVPARFWASFPKIKSEALTGKRMPHTASRRPK
jgi:nitroimidazol reductase NimA-like FMN-containing flavoprotein (pyridoxamine 5'-phosphate oxidase superfamily)